LPALWTVLAVLLAWNAAWWIVLGTLLAPVLPGGWAAVVVAAVLLFLPVLVLARGFGRGGYPAAATRVWLLRPFWYGQLFLPLLAVAGAAGALVGWPLGAAARGGRLAVAGVGLALAGLAFWGYLGTRRLVVRRLDVSLDRLPPALDGLRIVQLSDLHVGPHTPRRHLARIADAVRRAEPDLIAHTGDQVDDYARDIEPFAAALGDLRAPLGVFAVAGNHDVFAGWDAVRVERGGTRFWVAGTGDPAARAWTRHGGTRAAPDVERTLADVPRDGFTLALAHNPALWPELAARGADLTLSGHTHHGQLSIPRLRWSVASVFLDLAMGLHREGRSVLYISPGTNYWGIPLRVGALPEVTVLTLRRGAAPLAP